MDDEDEILAGLNESQRAAVTTTEGYVRVIAGAGSGKTRALVRRFAYLVLELGIMPANILCVTFTNKAAMEMRSRIHQLTGDNDTGYINTFHGFCVSVLQEDSYAVGYPKRFLVLDNEDIDAMLARIYEERGLTLRDKTYKMARDMFEMRKLFDEPEYYLDMIALPLAQLKEKYDAATDIDDILFYGYLYEEKKCFGLDYNDLIKFTLYIFHEKPAIRDKWQQRLEYIMIDEFQDIDQLQYDLMKVLCGWHRNLFIVGDPDQTIYTWRGASGKFLQDFAVHFPGTHDIYMLDNYRSTPEIIAVANSLIARNVDRIKKDLVAQRPGAGPVICHHADSAAQEAAWLAGEVGRLHAEQGVPYGHIAVLYRAHFVTRNIEEALLRKDIPYTIYSGVQFFLRREIKDALAYLRMIAFQDDLAFARIVNVPKRNIGQRRMAFLREQAEERESTLYEAMKATQDDPIWRGTQADEFIALVERFAAEYAGQPISDVLAALLDASGYETMLRTEGSQERLDNLAELKQSVRDYEIASGEEAELADYLSHVALFSNRDAATQSDKVQLMTVHTAKGLEFPYVFLVALDEGVFPSRKTRTREAMEEERRLAFVALTRAERGLYLSDAGGLNFDGSVRYPSRFILDIDQSLLHYDSPIPATLLRDARSYIQHQQRNASTAQPIFAAGDRIVHKAFGPGTIREVDSEGKAYTIHFDKLDTDRKISFRVQLRKLVEMDI